MDSIAGLPAHPLIVHAVVVLVPLAALGALAALLFPRVRGQIGWYVAAAAVLNVVLVPLATSSGESLEHRVSETAELEKHTDMAEGLLPFVLALAVGAVALMLIDRYRRRQGGVEGASRSLLTAPWVAIVVAVVVGLGGVGSLVQTLRIGHSGASATWDDTPTSDTGGAQGDD